MARQLSRVPPPPDRAEDEADPLLSFQAETDLAANPAPQPAATPAQAFEASIGQLPATRRTAIAVALGTMVVLAIAAGALAFFQMRTPAAPVKPAVAPTGSVAFTSEPSGATIAVDGQAKGATPLKLSLPAGQHIIEFALGDIKRSLPVTVDAGTVMAQHVEFATPTTQSGRLEVITDPQGARVSIDGTPRGVTPLKLDNVDVGEHKITIATDRTTIQRTVTVSAGSTASVMASAAPAGSTAGFVQIKSPVDLQIFEDGQLLGSTGAARLMLPSGRHDLEVANAALEFRAPLKVDIEPGKTANATVALPNGSLSVNALPWAEVTIDGRSAGTTPLGNLSVPIGAHEITWRHPQFGERKQTVSVTARTPVRVGMDLTK